MKSTNTKFSLFDKDAGLYLKNLNGYEIPNQAGQPGNAYAKTAEDAKTWQSAGWAKRSAIKINKSRSAPAGSSRISDRVQPRQHVEMHELDDQNTILEQIPCEP